MAKRRKVSAPSAEDLNALEERFRGETSEPVNPGLSPISQVSAEAARMSNPLDADTRATQAATQAEADAYRKARDEGRVLIEIPLDDIDENALVRDRAVIDAEALDELERSIEASGMRLPIEVFAQDIWGQVEGEEGGKPYGLVSGYRRLIAMRRIRDRAVSRDYDTIKAILRRPETMGAALSAMIEENEIRASLTPYERGRVAVLAAQQGVFGSTDAAITELFAQASRSKRSKIRSFAMIFEELGDLLPFADLLKERQGLRLTAALRNGAAAELRAELDRVLIADPGAQWPVIEPIVKRFEKAPVDPARGGRPKTAETETFAKVIQTESGLTLHGTSDGRGHKIEFHGTGLDGDRIEAMMDHLAAWLDKD